MVMGSNSVVSATPSFRSSAVVSTSASSSSDGCTSGSSSAGRVDVGRRGFLGGLIAVGVGGINGGGAVGEEMAALEVGLQEGRLRGCDGRPPCVSTSAFQSPSRFMPPWTYLGTQEHAYVALKSALARMGAQVVKEDGRRYVYAVLQSATQSKEDIDDLEFLFKGKVVCYRSVSRVFIPDPPFCWWAGCINGPRNRGRLEKLRDDLGWMPLETDEDKHWVPLLLH
ncbi:hypothetical protein KC19_VG206600 [Ceratodon purpureus]|uniref:Uncharacterized protein n=1 Tax=Ceratodon purpureus TaxID=3225 RepID=A0A8T0HS07_CERPU|nr:hypothetical protein KC19_VG206600 [Ceratodon purpureus]